MLRVKKKLWSVLLALALLMTLAPGAQAEENVALTLEIRGSGSVRIGNYAPTSVNDTKYFAPGTTVTLTATPAAGYRLAYWTDDHCNIWTGTPGSNEYTVTVYGDTACICEFVPITDTYSAEWVIDENVDMTFSSGAYTLDCGTASVGYDKQDGKWIRVLNTQHGE